jgi:Protein of unknown function (DUF3987)
MFTLHPAALHGVAGKLVNTLLPHTEADLTALLIHLLAGFGSIIGRNAYCSVDGAKHYSNIFFVCVGATAKGRKGTSWNRIKGILELVDPEWVATHTYSGLSTGEGLIAAAAHLGGTTSDTDTPAADKRMFIMQQEFASTLKVMTRPGNNLSGVIRDAWDTGTFQVMVKKNPVKVEDAHVSVVGHITSEELRRNLTLTEWANGFANRFLWVRSSRSKPLPEGGNLSEQEITALAALLKPAVDFGRKAALLERNQEAKEFWAEIYPDLSEGELGMLGAITSRAEAQVLRLSMLYALLDCSSTIRRCHLEAALAVWGYCEQTAHWIFGDDLGDSTADEILALLKRTKVVTRDEIVNHFSRHRGKEEIGRALALLQRRGLALLDFENTEGRRVQLWRAVTVEEYGPVRENDPKDEGEATKDPAGK